jgi:hypothetical protein
MVARIRLKDPIARRLRELGCTELQIQRHLQRGKMTPIVSDCRRWPGSWRSWTSRIMRARSERPRRRRTAELVARFGYHQAGLSLLIVAGIRTFASSFEPATLPSLRQHFRMRSMQRL